MVWRSTDYLTLLSPRTRNVNMLSNDVSISFLLKSYCLSLSIINYIYHYKIVKKWYKELIN